MRSFIPLLLLLSMLFSCQQKEALTESPSLPESTPVTFTQNMVFPDENILTEAAEVYGIDSGYLGSLTRTVHAENQVSSFLIMKNGKAIHEFYREGVDEHTLFNVYSITKSIVSALVGIALQEGYIESIDVPVSTYFPALLNDPDTRKQSITIRHLLSMTSGFAWPELSDWSSTFAAMTKTKDWCAFVLSRPLEHEPGTTFNYNSGTSHVLSAILQKAIDRPLLDYAREKLFDPIGIGSLIWPQDPMGYYNGGAWIQMSTEDLARFGLLYLAKGKWNDTQIISSSWIEESTTAHSPGKHFETGAGGDYGYLWWISADEKARPFAWGAMEQYIFIFPEDDALAVFTSYYQQAATIPPLLVQKFILPALAHETYREDLIAMNPDSEGNLIHTSMSAGN